MTSLEHRTALVTGGSRGLGRSMAAELAGRGAKVYLTYLENKDAADEAVDAITANGGAAVALRADVGSADDVERLRQEVGPVDVLVNNAGAILRPGAWNEQSDEDLVATVNMHLVGPLRLVRLFAPDMVESGFGRIVNITSTYAITGAAPVLAYTAAKAGLISLTYSMARELGGSGVTVNAIAPGNIDTAMTQSAGQGAIDWAVSTTPVGRLGAAAEIAQALGYLVDAESVTGQVLVVDGGQILNM